MKLFAVVGWLLVGFILLSLFFEPIKSASASATDDLKSQMKQMEKVVRKQQEMLENLKMKVEQQEQISKSSVVSIDDSEIGNKMEEYLQNAEGKGLLEKYHFRKSSTLCITLGRNVTLDITWSLAMGKIILLPPMLVGQ